MMYVISVSKLPLHNNVLLSIDLWLRQTVETNRFRGKVLNSNYTRPLPILPSLVESISARLNSTTVFDLDQFGDFLNSISPHNSRFDCVSDENICKLCCLRMKTNKVTGNKLVAQESDDEEEDLSFASPANSNKRLKLSVKRMKADEISIEVDSSLMISTKRLGKDEVYSILFSTIDESYCNCSVNCGCDSIEVDNQMFESNGVSVDYPKISNSNNNGDDSIGSIILSIYSCVQYIRLSRDIQYTFPSLFEVELASVPIKHIIQILSLNHIHQLPTNKILLESLIYLLNDTNMYPELFLSDRINDLKCSPFVCVNNKLSLVLKYVPMIRNLSWQCLGKYVTKYLNCSEIPCDDISALENDISQKDDDFLLSLSIKNFELFLRCLSVPQLNRIGTNILLSIIFQIDSVKVLDMPTCMSVFEVFRLIHIVHPLPQTYELLIVNYLLDMKYVDSSIKLISTYRKLVEEPIILFKISFEFLSNPILFKILMFILRSLMITSNALFSQVLLCRKAMNAYTHRIQSQMSNDLSSKIIKSDFVVNIEIECYSNIQDIIIAKLLLSFWQQYIQRLNSHNLKTDSIGDCDQSQFESSDLRMSSLLKKEFIFMIEWLHSHTNGKLIKLLMYYELHDIVHWKILLSSSVLSSEIASHLILLITIPADVNKCTTSRQYFNTLLYCVYYLQYSSIILESLSSDEVYTSKIGSVLYQYTHKILTLLPRFIVNEGIEFITVFHPLDYLLEIDEIISQLIDIMTHNSMPENMENKNKVSDIVSNNEYHAYACSFCSLIFNESTESYSTKRFKDVIYAKYGREANSVNSFESFAFKVLKDSKYQPSQEVDECQVIGKRSNSIDE